MPLKLVNSDKLRREMTAAVRAHVQSDVLPVMRGLLFSAAERVVKGYEGFVGTPQWSGNAAANWYFTEGTPATQFAEVFDKPLDNRAAFSALHPNQQAWNESLARIAISLLSYQGGVGYLTNTAPYLPEYEEYGGDKKFRLANLFPLVPAAAAAELLIEANTMSKSKAEEFKARWRT